MNTMVRRIHWAGGACLLLAWLGVAPLAHAAASGAVTLEFTTVPTGGKYSPRHVLAVWVTDANTNFVKTVCRYGVKRQKYLTAWQTAREGDATVDGITGATRKSHGPLTVTWDGRDAHGQALPDGAYLFFVEFADAHDASPQAVFPVNKGPRAEVKTFRDQEHFTHIKLTVQPSPP
jgi:hypothetical protein